MAAMPVPFNPTSPDSNMGGQNKPTPQPYRPPLPIDPWDDQIVITKVAGYLPDWQDVLKKLGVGSEDIKGIQTNHRADVDRRKAALRKWIDKKGSDATYRKLCTALMSLGHKGAVQDIGKIVGSSNSSQDMHSLAANDVLLDAKKLYANAMKRGRPVERKSIKCLLVGAAGVGKTCIKHLLLDKPLPERRESTGVLDNPAVAVSISRAIMQKDKQEDKDSWYIVDNDKGLRKMIAKLIKADKRKDEATDIATNDTTQEESSDTGYELKRNEKDEPVARVESQEDEDFDMIKDVMEAEGGENLSTTWIHFLDSGGQPEFHDLLPIFVQNASIVVFVLKLSEGLDIKPMVEYCVSDGHKYSYQSYLSHKEILEHCMKVFHAQDSKVRPTILLIGTHKDHQQKLNVSELDKCLKELKHDVIYFGEDQPIAMLDCLSTTDEEKTIIKEVKTVILKAIQNTESETIPMPWFGLELALKRRSEKENSKPKGILTYAQCKQEADKFDFFKTNLRQFEAAFKHLVKYNIFLHYHYPEVLLDLVFCDPQVLLSMVTQIVQHHYETKCGKAIKGIKFIKNAYISIDILKEIFPQFWDQNKIFTPEMFLELLSRLTIISVVSASECSKEYFMPALLTNINDPVAEVEKIHGRTKHLPPLCIRFNCGCVPNGVFCSVVSTLLQKDWKLCEKNGKPICCYRNCIAFTYARRTITLVDFYSHFSIYLFIPEDCNDKDPLPVAIKNKIHNSIKAFPHSIVEFQDAIECPQHPEKVAIWYHTPDDYYQCTDDTQCSGPIPSCYQTWKEGDNGSTSSNVTHHKQKESRTDEDKSSGDRGKKRKEPEALSQTQKKSRPDKDTSLGCSLDDQIEEKYVTKIAGHIRDWQGVFKELGLGEEDIRDIKTDNRAPADQRKAALRQWIGENGEEATYRALCTALKSLGHNGAAQDIEHFVARACS